MRNRLRLFGFAEAASTPQAPGPVILRGMVETMSSRDTATLRTLAGQLADLASRPENDELEAAWRAHNALQGDRPMLLCFPEGAWPELVPEAALVCESDLAREWERSLRMDLYTAEVLRDDQPVPRTFDIRWHVTVGDYGVPVTQHRSEERGSFVYEHPLRNLPDDLERLHHRPLSVDRAETHRRVEQATQIFGDIYPARIHGSYWWTLGLTWEAIKLIGLETLMLAPYDQPESLHALLAWLRDEHLAFVRWFENEGLLSDQNGNDYVGSGGLGFTTELPQDDRPPDHNVRLMDRWGFAEAQETVGMSPTMFAEFILPYQRPLLELFGLNCYGCCEPVNERFDAILTIPRLRRVSISPWADQEVSAATLGRSYVYSRKPNPAPVCVDFDEDAIRREFRQTLSFAGDLPLEIIMKDTHTVQEEPWRLARWVEIGREEISRA